MIDIKSKAGNLSCKTQSAWEIRGQQLVLRVPGDRRKESEETRVLQ